MVMVARWPDNVLMYFFLASRLQISPVKHTSDHCTMRLCSVFEDAGVLANWSLSAG